MQATQATQAGDSNKSMGKRTISALTPHRAQAQVPGRRPNVEAKIWRRWTGPGRLGGRDGIITVAQQGCCACPAMLLSTTFITVSPVYPVVLDCQQWQMGHVVRV